ncbi:MAG TPA: FAD-dependent oxidoreductase [Micromonosporaceae bacterium]|nr:FAD-dependent oxidoreductase [Micromonosporaceae bacterium]
MRTVILGAGMTGLAAGRASGGTVYEAAAAPGGICSSYYMVPGDARPHPERPGAAAYRFEVGGGHWIFGGDPAVLALIDRLAGARRYERRSSVFFPEDKLRVPYPLQNHLRHLGPDVAARALAEMTDAVGGPPAVTLQDWLRRTFGRTLCDLFFDPFHALYTGGLHARIAPQDGYKSPVDLKTAVAGAFAGTAAVGYNATFVYPPAGLDGLARALAGGCRVEYGRRAVSIDARARTVGFADGGSVEYDRLISTLPLNTALAIARLDAGPPDPCTSVLVLNIGARRAGLCPDDHWVYVPRSRAGFHRVGFYSNVDGSFLPEPRREDLVSIYVERAHGHGARPDAGAIARYAEAVVAELQDWGFIGDAEVVHPTWIDVAYTWAWPGSRWRADALQLLDEHGITQVGRYGRWTFQGIADSIRDGLYVGASLAGD